MVWLLGPAVVAMAVPIWERRSLILANWPVLAAVVCLSLICAIGSLVLLRGLLGDEVARALTLKSVVALDNFGEWSRHPLSGSNRLTRATVTPWRGQRRVA